MNDSRTASGTKDEIKCSKALSANNNSIYIDEEVKQLQQFHEKCLDFSFLEDISPSRKNRHARHDAFNQTLRQHHHRQDYDTEKETKQVKQNDTILLSPYYAYNKAVVNPSHSQMSRQQHPESNKRR